MLRKKMKPRLQDLVLLRGSIQAVWLQKLGGPNGNRTRLLAVTVRNTNRYTIGPKLEVRVGLEPTALRICNPLHWPLCHRTIKLVEMIGFEPIAFLKYRIYSPGPLHHRSRISK